MSALELSNVTVAYRQQGRMLAALREVSLELKPGQLYGLVGESGSGKSTLALAALRYLPDNARLMEGTVRLGGQDVYKLSRRGLQKLWRERVKFVPQNPLPALSPSQRIRRQLAEAIRPQRPQQVPLERVLHALAQVGLADPKRVASSYPHELSGGMQQRVMIAMALAGEPELLILDEPTTNLDVTTEATILDLVRTLTTDKQTAVLYVSHNLGVVAQLCDRVAVLYAGELLEDASTEALYHKSYHPYTMALLGAVPRLGQQKTERRLTPIPGGIPPLDALPEGCIFAERCPVAVPECRSGRIPLVPFDDGGALRQSRCLRAAELAAGELQLPQPSAVDTAASAVASGEVVLKMSGLRKQFRVPHTLLDRLMGRPKRAVRAVDGVSLRLKQAQTLGLVGESGSGKSTLARLIVGLYPYDEGELELLSVPLKRQLAARDKAALKRLQMVFQSSEEALNPYRTVGDILRRPFHKLAGMRYAEADAAARKLLAAVKLSEGYLARLPGELSGGERQRVAIARAFATEPELLILDESVSGLDVSVQAAILNLLAELQLERGVSYLFVSHDLAAVSYLADRIAVMYLGHLMQVAATSTLLTPPYHPYTEALLSAIPLAKPQRAWSVRLKGEIPSPTAIPSGCRFHSRCPRYLGDICRTQEPPWQTTADGGRIYCHIPLDELKALQTPLVLGARDAELST